MCFLHERRAQPVLHGDLKTSNLLLEGDGQKIVIADFGLACWLHAPSTAMQQGALTASISPPEVLMSPTAPRTAAADVYAFGMVLLEIMIGHPPFQGMRSAQIKEAVLAGARPTLPAGVPASIAAIITQCWSTDPAARPTFKDIVNRLETALNEYRSGWQTTTMMDSQWA
jgi:serine/threonine protein kinase